MKRVLKYAFDGVHLVALLPPGAMPVRAAPQLSHINLWVEVPEDQSCTVSRVFTVFTTGQNVPDDAVYVDTVFIDDFVFHIYEVFA